MEIIHRRSLRPCLACFSRGVKRAVAPDGLLPRSDLYRRALELIPGGVNSPVRAMRGVGLDEPLFVRSGAGAYIDTESGRFLDWVMSWGPLVFGHADAETVEAVR